MEWLYTLLLALVLGTAGWAVLHRKKLPVRRRVIRPVYWIPVLDPASLDRDPRDPDALAHAFVDLARATLDGPLGQALTVAGRSHDEGLREMIAWFIAAWVAHARRVGLEDCLVVFTAAVVKALESPEWTPDFKPYLDAVGTDADPNPARRVFASRLSLPDNPAEDSAVTSACRAARAAAFMARNGMICGFAPR